MMVKLMFKRVCVKCVRLCMQARDATSLLHRRQFSPSATNVSSPYTHIMHTNNTHIHDTSHNVRT